MRFLLPAVTLALSVAAVVPSSEGSEHSGIEERGLFGLGGIFGGVNSILHGVVPGLTIPTAGLPIPVYQPVSSGLTFSQPSTTAKVIGTSTVATPTATTSSFPVNTKATVTSVPTQFLLSPTFQITNVPRIRVFDFVIDARKGSPDGFQRNMFVVNGQAEGPLLEANQGDTIHVHVTNNLNTGVAMHWHGMAQNGTAWADGPNGITQCPIPAGSSFDYVFVLDRPDQYGTYWWHAHRGAMYADGLTGPFVIHSPNDPLKRGRDYDIDQIMFLRDNFHSMSTDIVDGLLTAAGFDGSPQQVILTILNSELLDDHRTLSEIRSHQRRRYLQLLIRTDWLYLPDKETARVCVSTEQEEVSVDGHSLNVVEADDTPVYGPVVHRVPIFVAQRYSVILDTSADKQGDSFYFRAQMNTDCFGADHSDLDPDVKAIIRISQPYLFPSKTTPASNDWGDALGGVCQDLDESLLVPRIASDAPAIPTIVGTFNAAFNFTQTGLFLWTLNGVTLENFMYDPLLLQVYRGQTLDATHVTNYVIPGIQTAEWAEFSIHYCTKETEPFFNYQSYHQQRTRITLTSLPAGADHPFHLHASKFWIVARGVGQLTPLDAALLNYNITNPLRRDVLTVPAGGYAVIRIISDIPGVHAFHCHIAWHQAAGLFGVFVVQPDEVRKMSIPAATFAMCKDFEGSDTILTTDPGRKRELLNANPPLNQLEQRNGLERDLPRLQRSYESTMVQRSAGHRRSEH
ncbi:hypothetical protein P7C70_g5173, partial [Phenoliferia sp. Uapishka_3]